MKEFVEKRFRMAQSGRKLWLSLVKEHDITDRTYVIVLPSYEEQKFTYVINAMENLIYLKTPDKVIVLSEKSDSECSKYSVVDFIRCTKEEINSIICLYSMYRFTPNLIVASLTEPAGRMGSGMMKKGNMDMEELFDMVSFGFCS